MRLTHKNQSAVARRLMMLAAVWLCVVWTRAAMAGPGEGGAGLKYVVSWIGNTYNGKPTWVLLVADAGPDEQIKIYDRLGKTPAVSATLFGEIGLLDLVQSVSASRRANGEYVVLLEDDAKAKIVMFRWVP